MLLIINFYFIVAHFNTERLSAVIFSAICAILAVDFGSGVVHWAADTWGSIELPVIGKVNTGILINLQDLLQSFPPELPSSLQRTPHRPDLNASTRLD
jgi:hypothetical protein